MEKLEEEHENEKNSSTKWTTEQIFTVGMFYVATISVGVYYSLLGPFFPQEAAKKGMNPTVMGVVFSVFELVIVIISPVIGAHLTKLGAKRVYIAGLLVSSIASASFGLLEYCPPGNTFTAMCIFLRIVEGSGVAAFETAMFAILANTFPNRLATVMGNLELFMGLGFMAGPPLGGVLFKAGGFKMPFLVTSLVNAIIAFIAIFVMPHQESLKQLSISKKRDLLKKPVVLLMVLSIFIATNCIGFINVALALQLNTVYHYGSAMVGLIFLVGPGLYAVSCPLWGCLADRVPQYSLLMMGLGSVLTGTCFVFMGPAPFLPIPDNTLWLLLVSLALFGIGLGPFVISFQVIASEAVKSGMPEDLNTFGLVSGLFTTAYSLGAFTGPLLAGCLLYTMQFEWTAFFFGCTSYFYVVVTLIYKIVAWIYSKVSSQSIENYEVQTEKASLVQQDQLQLNYNTD